jgi:hypothetical protein
MKIKKFILVGVWVTICDVWFIIFVINSFYVCGL